MVGYFGIIGHSSWLDDVHSGIPDGIKQLLHVLTAVNMQNKAFLAAFLGADLSSLDWQNVVYCLALCS